MWRIPVPFGLVHVLSAHARSGSARVLKAVASAPAAGRRAEPLDRLYPVLVTPDAGLPNGGVLERALAALDGLADLGEQVEDEWQYVNDLRTVYRARLTTAFAELGGADALSPGGEIEAAVDAAIEEAELIVDPNRAIDWLSTFPQIVLVALGVDA